jgi:hypothetical protein
MRRMSSWLATSARIAFASPPSFAITPAVSFAAPSLTSAHSTFAPSRANSTAAALPFPQPGPTDPAPTTSATLSRKRPAISSSKVAIQVRLLAH